MLDNKRNLLVTAPGAEITLYGIDAGVAEICSGGFRGLQVAAMSWTERDDVYGVQASALANVVNASTIALQLAPVNVVWEDVVGVQLGVVNVGENGVLPLLRAQF